MELYLATTSKFKSSILDQVKMKHKCIESNFDENIQITNPYELVKKLSEGKAKSAIGKISSGIVMGLDTISYLDGKIYEKPKSIDEARNNLKECSNKTVSVITGITIIDVCNNKEYIDYQETKISFSDITDEDIQYYMENEKHVMHASGFIIETIASCFLNKIEGSFYNILGVPVEKIYKILNALGYHLNDLE